MHSTLLILPLRPAMFLCFFSALNIMKGARGQIWVSLTDDICSSICAAECSSPCQNGVTCTAPDTCTCDVGWTGIQCETGWYCVTTCLCLKLFVSTPAIQILPSFMCIGLQRSVNKVRIRERLNDEYCVQPGNNCSRLMQKSITCSCMPVLQSALYNLPSTVVA